MKLAKDLQTNTIIVNTVRSKVNSDTNLFFSSKHFSNNSSVSLFSTYLKISEKDSTLSFGFPIIWQLGRTSGWVFELQGLREKKERARKVIAL
jgi:hypothetical protein